MSSIRTPEHIAFRPKGTFASKRTFGNLSLQHKECCIKGCKRRSGNRTVCDLKGRWPIKLVEHKGICNDHYAIDFNFYPRHEKIIRKELSKVIYDDFFDSKLSLLVLASCLTNNKK